MREWDMNLVDAVVEFNDEAKHIKVYVLVAWWFTEVLE